MHSSISYFRINLRLEGGFEARRRVWAGQKRSLNFAGTVMEGSCCCLVSPFRHQNSFIGVTVASRTNRKVK